MSSKSLSDHLQSIRSARGWSQEELAAQLNVSFATVNRWEGGKSKPQRRQQEAIDRLLAEVEGGAADGGANDTPASSRRRRGTRHSKVLGNKSMEQMLWDAACSIRGEKDAPKFKDYLLPILFIKRLSDVFDDEVARLSEEYGDRDVALEVIESEAEQGTPPDERVVRFYLPPAVRWAVVSGRAPFKWPKKQAPKSLGEQLTTTCRLITRSNPMLSGIVDLVDFNHVGAGGEREISDAALKGVIETFSDPRYRLGLHDVEPDFLGRCYEYLLRKFAEGSGSSAGEFFTPTEVGFLMAEVVRPRPGETAYDYACGSGGLLIKLQLVAERLDPAARKIPLKLCGQELQGSSYAIARMNTVIHDLQADLVRGDSMRNPKFRTPDGQRLRTFDLIVANPMWNQTFDPDVYEKDSFDRFEKQGGLTTGKADWPWLQHTAACLAKGGRAAVVLDTGAVSRGSGGMSEDKERAIRKWFVEQDLIYGVILLPDNLFYNTPAPGIIIVLRREKPKDRRGRIMLINASGEFKKGTPKNYLTEEAIAKIAKTYQAGQNVEGFARVITTEQAVEADYNLAPSRHVVAESIRTSREIHEIIQELDKLERKSAMIDKNLKRMLAPLLAQREAE
jgi:type I restriction enzyme M protein